MTQSAIFIDAGFLLGAGGTIVTGTSLRGAVTVNFPKLIAGIVDCTRKNSGLEPLRVYWYDASQGGFTEEHKRIALLEDVKVRLGRINYDGAQKGVDLRLGLDLVEVARTQAAQVAYLLSGDDDLAEAVIAAQDLGMKVALIGLEDPRSRLGVASVAEHLALQVDRIVALEQHFIKDVIRPRASTTVDTESGIPTPANLAGIFGAAVAAPGSANESERGAGLAEEGTAEGASREAALESGAPGVGDMGIGVADKSGSVDAAGLDGTSGAAGGDPVEEVGPGSADVSPRGNSVNKVMNVPTPREVTLRSASFTPRPSDPWRSEARQPTRDLIDLFKVADEVGESVASKWLDHATQTELNELMEYHPTLPPEIDRVLLRDCASRIGEADTDSQLVRRQLRQAFWRVVSGG